MPATVVSHLLEIVQVIIFIITSRGGAPYVIIIGLLVFVSLIELLVYLAWAKRCNALTINMDDPQYDTL
jgi:hypothetical protein